MNIIVLVTCANQKEAEKISKALVKKKLCACVNIVADIKSIFYWQEKIQSCSEILLIAKSIRPKFTEIVKLVKTLHSYEVPEIIALPVVTGEKKYLSWVRKSIS